MIFYMLCLLRGIPIKIKLDFSMKDVNTELMNLKYIKVVNDHLNGDIASIILLYLLKSAVNEFLHREKRD